MDNFETIIVVTAALATSGLCVTAFVGWWVNGTVQSGTDELRESTGELRACVEKQSESLDPRERRHARDAAGGLGRRSGLTHRRTGKNQRAHPV